MTANNCQAALALGSVAKAWNTSPADLLQIDKENDWMSWIDVNIGIAYVVGEQELLSLEQAKEDAEKEKEEMIAKMKGQRKYTADL